MLKRIKETLTCNSSGRKRESRTINRLKSHHLLHSDKSTYTYFYKGKVRDFFKSRLTPTQPCTNGVWCASPHCDKVNTPTVSTLANRTQRSQDITPYSAVAGRANMLGNSRFSTIPLVLSAFGLLLVLGLSVGCVGGNFSSDSVYAEDNNNYGLDTQANDPSISLSLADTANSGNMTITGDDKSIQEQVDTTSNTGYIAVDFHVTATNIDKYDVYVQSSSQDLIGKATGNKVKSIVTDTVYADMKNQTGWGYAVAKTSKADPESLTYKPIRTATNSAADTGSATNTTVDQTYTLAFAANLSGVSVDHYTSDILLSVAANAEEVLNLYSITYSTNNSTSGVAPAAQTVETGSTSYIFDLTEQIDFAREGYSFRGWAETSGATTAQYKPGETVTLNNSAPRKTLYAVWQPVVNMLTSLANMQAMTSTICAQTTTPTKWDANSAIPTAQITDNRDNKKYWVAKLADGNCWMTQNLALDLNGKTLTTANSDVLNNWSAASGMGSSVWDSTITANGIRWYHSDVGSGHDSYGNAYSWGAATAGTAGSLSTSTSYPAQATSSICPKGWRLPIGYVSGSENIFYSTDKTFARLVTTYGAESDYYKLRSAPLYFVTSGYIYSGSIYSLGGAANYWTSTAASTASAYSFYFGANAFQMAANSDRYAGLSIRCVAK